MLTLGLLEGLFGYSLPDDLLSGTANPDTAAGTPASGQPALRFDVGAVQFDSSNSSRARKPILPNRFASARPAANP